MKKHMKRKSDWSPRAEKSMAYKLGLSKYPYSFRCDFRSDGLGSRGKSLKALHDPAFVKAWAETGANYTEITGNEIPDIRWRSHIAVWAAHHGLSLEGDFVDCGVWTGIMAQMICRLTDLHKSNKSYWLFDTWTGIPTAGLVGSDLSRANKHNSSTYHQHSAFDAVKANFAKWKNCKLVQGVLPQSIETVKIEKISYLSVDLNNSVAEKGCLDLLWPKLVPGAFVVIDDYDWNGNDLQRDMWDSFAASKHKMIATLPTGQGLIIV
jgi:hypothetical protein